MEFCANKHCGHRTESIDFPDPQNFHLVRSAGQTFYFSGELSQHLHGGFAIKIGKVVCGSQKINRTNVAFSAN